MIGTVCVKFPVLAVAGAEGTHRAREYPEDGPPDKKQFLVDLADALGLVEGVAKFAFRLSTDNVSARTELKEPVDVQRAFDEAKQFNDSARTRKADIIIIDSLVR